MKRIGRYGFVSLALAASIASAQDQKATGYVELGGGTARLTGGATPWSSTYLRGSYGVPGQGRFVFDVSGARRYGENGYFIGMTYIADVRPDLAVALGLGTGPAGFYFPKFRADAAVTKKWGPKLNLLTTVGATYILAKETYRDYTGFFDVAYYLPEPIILQAGVRYGISYPGAVKAGSAWVGALFGRTGHTTVGVRYSVGKTAYLLMGANSTLVDFADRAFSVSLRQWLSRDWGFTAGYDYYTNPSFQKTTFEIGVFRDF